MRKMIFHSIESLSLNQSQSTHAPTLCDYFSSSTSASDSDNLVLTTSNEKRNVNDGVVRGIGTLFSLDSKPYASGSGCKKYFKI